MQPKASKRALEWLRQNKAARLAGHPALRLGLVGPYPLSPHLSSLAQVPHYYNIGPNSAREYDIHTHWPWNHEQYAHLFCSSSPVRQDCSHSVTKGISVTKSTESLYRPPYQIMKSENGCRVVSCITFGLVSLCLCPVVSLSKALKLHQLQGHCAPDPTLLSCWKDELYPSGMNHKHIIISMTLYTLTKHCLT